MPRTTTLGKKLFALSLACLTARPGLATPPVDRDDVRFEHNDCDPARYAGVLRDLVIWSAREAEPIALGAQFTDVTGGSHVNWRLVLKTMDGRILDSTTGSSVMDQGNGFATVTFDGRDFSGKPMAPGTYVYMYEAPGFKANGGFLRVLGNDEEMPVLEDSREPMATSANPSVPYNFYYGTQHAHTIYSDGGTPVASCSGSVQTPHAGADPAAAFAYAKTTGGVNWIDVIDHNHLLNEVCSGDCSNAGIQARYQAGFTAAAANTDSTFVGFYGMEWSTNANGHVSLADVNKIIGPVSAEPYSQIDIAHTDYLGLYTAANNPANQLATGAVGSFCHPESSQFSNYAQNAAGLNLIVGIAVISGSASSNATDFRDQGTRYSGPKAGGGDKYQYVLQRGWKVGPEGHQDNHCFNYGTHGRTRTVLLAPSLTKANLMAARKARRFFTTSDLNAQMFFGTADYAHVMGETFTTSASTLDLRMWASDPDGSAISTVTLWEGDPAAGTGSPTSLTMTNAGGGSYTATVNVPATGTKYWYAYATLANGGELFSAPIWVSKGGSCGDTTAPTATVTAPSASTVTGTVSVTASGTDNVGVTGMTLKIDGAQVATSTTGSVSYSWNTSALTAGSTHTLVATASDACGNVGTSTTKTVTIGSSCTDVTAPTATITAPTAASVTGTVSVTASGTDNIGVTGMTLKVDGAQVATSTTGSVSYSWNTSALTVGSSHTLVATATDACGNTGTSTTKTVTIGSSCTDTTLPTVTITAPTTGSSVSGTVAVTVAGTDNIGVTGMTLKVDGTQVATSTTGSLSYSWNTSALTAGSSHTLVATASDACGNVKTSATTTVTIAGSGFVSPILNGSFETGVPPTSWTETGSYEQSTGTATASSGASVSPQAGTKMMWLGGYANADDYLYQTVTVPNVAGNVNLNFWTRIVTMDGTTTAYDYLYLDVYDSTGTTRLGTLITLSNKNASSAWAQKTALSLNTYKGQTVRLRFHATNDGSNDTDFFVDNVTMTNP